MLVTHQPVLRRLWHALFPARAIGVGATPFALLGEYTGA